MAKAHRKIIQAGQLWMAVQYTAIRGAKEGQQRGPKILPSNLAREHLNMRYSWQKLMLTLYANFNPNDLLVTLTYHPNKRPARRDDANRNLSNFIRALRKVRNAKGQPLFYVRVTEDHHGDKNIPHHLIVTSTGADFETIRTLWAKYGDNVDFEQFGSDGPERWAKYLTKEPAELGRRRVGERTWRTSLHMKKPTITTELVPDTERLLPPVGSYILDTNDRQNCYGCFSYCDAILPEPQLNTLNSDLG